MTAKAVLARVRWLGASSSASRENIAIGTNVLIKKIKNKSVTADLSPFQKVQNSFH